MPTRGRTVGAIGAPELIILLFVIGPLFVIPVWALVDIIQQPDHSWQATGRNQTAWLLGLILTWLLGFGVVGAVVAIVYLVGPRQDLNRAARGRTTPTAQSAASGWYPNPDGDGERYWDGSKWTDNYRDPSLASSSDPTSASQGGSSVSERLDQLEQLRQQDKISDGEYQRQRERLLDEL